MYTGIRPVVVHINRSVAGMTTIRVSSVTGILYACQKLTDLNAAFYCSLFK